MMKEKTNVYENFTTIFERLLELPNICPSMPRTEKRIRKKALNSLLKHTTPLRKCQLSQYRSTHFILHKKYYSLKKEYFKANYLIVNDISREEKFSNLSASLKNNYHTEKEDWIHESCLHLLRKYPQLVNAYHTSFREFDRAIETQFKNYIHTMIYNYLSDKQKKVHPSPISIYQEISDDGSLILGDTITDCSPTAEGLYENKNFLLNCCHAMTNAGELFALLGNYVLVIPNTTTADLLTKLSPRICLEKYFKMAGFKPDEYKVFLPMADSFGLPPTRKTLLNRLSDCNKSMLKRVEKLLKKEYPSSVPGCCSVAS